jgi:hypothetical protein
VGESRFQRLKQGFVAAFLVAFLGGCATPPPPRDPAEVVKQRAQARWNALVQGDVKAAYEFFSPGSRATMSLADFASGIKVGFWKAVTVDKVECKSAESCDASSTVEYEFRGSRIKTPFKETWVREGSDWWLLRR